MLVHRIVQLHVGTHAHHTPRVEPSILCGLHYAHARGKFAHVHDLSLNILVLVGKFRQVTRTPRDTYLVKDSVLLTF